MASRRKGPNNLFDDNGGGPSVSPQAVANRIFGGMSLNEDYEDVVEIASIIIDQRLQMRQRGLDESYVDVMVTALEGGGEINECVVLFKDSTGELRLADGFHRTEAHMRAGRTTIKALIKSGNFETARLYAEEANLKHGMNLTSQDKKAILFSRIARGHKSNDIVWGKLSTAALASELGVDKKTVSNWLNEYATVENSTLDRTIVFGLDGREYRTERIVEATKARRVDDDDDLHGLIDTSEPLPTDSIPAYTRPPLPNVRKLWLTAIIAEKLSDDQILEGLNNPEIYANPDKAWAILDMELARREGREPIPQSTPKPQAISDLSKARDINTPYIDALEIAQRYLRHVEREGSVNSFWNDVAEALWRVHNINVDDMELEHHAAPAHSIPPIHQTAPTPSQAATAALFDEATRALLLAYADAGRNYGFDTTEVILLAHMNHAQAAEYAAIDWLALYNRVTDGTLNAISSELANRLFEAYETVRTR